MRPFDINSYDLQRNPDNTISRIYRWGGDPETEISPEYITDRIAQEIENKARIIADLEAQRDKLAAFEAENPPFIIEQPVGETTEGRRSISRGSQDSQP